MRRLSRVGASSGALVRGASDCLGVREDGVEAGEEGEDGVGVGGSGMMLRSEVGGLR